ncbi:MAG: hypothetical protein WAW52_07350 [Methanothrix sp.]
MAFCTNGSSRMSGDGHYLLNITLAREIMLHGSPPACFALTHHRSSWHNDLLMLAGHRSPKRRVLQFDLTFDREQQPKRKSQKRKKLMIRTILELLG